VADPGISTIAAKHYEELTGGKSKQGQDAATAAARRMPWQQQATRAAFPKWKNR
jgi:hypothetical protein